MSRRGRSRRGITPKQAKYLADLQRKLHVPYTGNGLTVREAVEAIQHCRRRLGLDPAPSAQARSIASYARVAVVMQAPKATARARERRARAEEVAAGLPARPRSESPTAVQLHDLQVLARRAGEPVPKPRSRGDAARELARLRSASP